MPCSLIRCSTVGPKDKVAPTGMSVVEVGVFLPLIIENNIIKVGLGTEDFLLANGIKILSKL